MISAIGLPLFIHTTEKIGDIKGQFESLFRQSVSDSNAWMEDNKGICRHDLGVFAREEPLLYAVGSVRKGFVIDNCDAWENGWLFVNPDPEFKFLVEKEFILKALTLGHVLSMNQEDE